jgi:hypothetical protein
VHDRGVGDGGDRVFVALYDVHPQDEQLLDEVEGAIAGRIGSCICGSSPSTAR